MYCVYNICLQNLPQVWLVFDERREAEKKIPHTVRKVRKRPNKIIAKISNSVAACASHYLTNPRR